MEAKIPCEQVSHMQMATLALDDGQSYANETMIALLPEALKEFCRHKICLYSESQYIGITVYVEEIPTGDCCLRYHGIDKEV